MNDIRHSRPESCIADKINVATNLDSVRTKIAGAALEVGRDAHDTTLVAVAKKHDAERITLGLEAGARVFGENRVQEAMEKWPALRERFSDMKLHLIGPLQSNKVKEAVSAFDVIETVDRPKIARLLAEETRKQRRDIQFFIQINTGEETQKTGIAPKDADAFIRQCREDFGLQPYGLMCIPPASEAPAPHFALLAKIARLNNLTGLSMGMSGDFEIAVRLGATHVRVGTAIFGERPPV